MAEGNILHCYPLFLTIHVHHMEVYRFSVRKLYTNVLFTVQEMCASQNMPAYINYQTVKNYISS